MIAATFLTSMTLLPLRPTPFPYTTLFRSLIFEHPWGRAAVLDLVFDEVRGERPAAPVVAHAAVEAVVVDGDRAVDRKSTRLNSSHSQISYAVFCLKKKKNQVSRIEWAVDK